MQQRGKWGAIMTAALLWVAFGAVACSLGDETTKANKLVEEGNAAAKEVRTLAPQGDEKANRMMQAVAAIRTREQLEEARNIARDLIANLDQTKEKCNEAARKFEEASRLKINDKFREYLTIKGQEYQKLAEATEAAKATPQELLVSESRSDFQNKAAANRQKVSQLVSAAVDLDKQAVKIQQENKDIIKS